jgi:hypothetical protein
VEAGVRPAAVFQGGYDAHGNIGNPSNTISPIFDQAFSALLEDSGSGGCWTARWCWRSGSSGGRRTLTIPRDGTIGRGVFDRGGGGGIPPGQVIGSSDAQGGAPKERPISI